MMTRVNQCWLGGSAGFVQSWRETFQMGTQASGPLAAYNVKTSSVIVNNCFKYVITVV